MQIPVLVAIIHAFIDARVMSLGEELILVTVQINCIQVRLNRIHTQDVVLARVRITIPEHSLLRTRKTGRDPVTNQFGHLS